MSKFIFTDQLYRQFLSFLNQG